MTSKKFLLPLVCCLATAISLPTAAEVRRYETVVFDTYVAVSVPRTDADASAAVEEIFDAFYEMHHRFSPWEDGELRAVNQAIADGQLPINISDEMKIMIELTQQYFTNSDGLFNPSIGHLIDLWGFHQNPTQPPPASAIAQWLQSKPQMTDIILQGNTLTAAPPSISLNFGAVAKGYALDKAKIILQKYKIKNALVDIGGNIMAVGKNGARHWRVALSPDRARDPLALVDLHDGETVATSGISERYFDFEGVRYHHIFDPRSGQPPRHIYSAVVITEAGAANAGAAGDALATALLIADDAEAQQFAERYGIGKIWRINRDGGEIISPALQQRLSDN